MQLTIPQAIASAIEAVPALMPSDVTTPTTPEAVVLPPAGGADDVEDSDGDESVEPGSSGGGGGGGGGDGGGGSTAFGDTTRPDAPPTHGGASSAAAAPSSDRPADSDSLLTTDAGASVAGDEFSFNVSERLALAAQADDIASSSDGDVGSLDLADEDRLGAARAISRSASAVIGSLANMAAPMPAAEAALSGRAISEPSLQSMVTKSGAFSGAATPTEDEVPAFVKAPPAKPAAPLQVPGTPRAAALGDEFLDAVQAYMMQWSSGIWSQPKVRPPSALWRTRRTRQCGRDDDDVHTRARGAAGKGPSSCQELYIAKTDHLPEGEDELMLFAGAGPAGSPAVLYVRARTRLTRPQSTAMCDVGRCYPRRRARDAAATADGPLLAGRVQHAGGRGRPSAPAQRRRRWSQDRARLERCQVRRPGRTRRWTVRTR